LVFGRPLLERIAATGIAEKAEVLEVELDMGMETDELKRLLALVQVIKGHHDDQSRYD
jgi:hypothetical protein